MALRSIKEYVLTQFRNFKTTILDQTFVAKETGKSLISSTDLAKIGTNENAIQTLNGNTSTVGSIANSIHAAIGELGEKSEGINFANVKDYVDSTIDSELDKFVQKVTDNDTIDTFKELVDYVAQHAPEAAGYASAIQTLNGSSDVAGSVAYTILQAIGTLGEKSEGVNYANVKDYVDTQIANATIEMEDIDFSTEWEVDG